MSMDGWERGWFDGLKRRVELLEKKVLALENNAPAHNSRFGERIVCAVNAEPPSPVDRTRQVLTDGSPVPADRSHTEDRGDGQQKGYVVLSADERAKGFVRPVRQVYVHETCGAETRMSLALAETYARDPKFYDGTYCATCRQHYPLNQFKWAGTEDIVGS